VRKGFMGRCFLGAGTSTYPDAVLFGKAFEGLLKAEMLMFLKKIDRIPPFVAAETVENLLFRADREGRRLLLVEGTQTEIVLPRLAQFHILGHDIQDIDPVEYLVQERTHSSSTTVTPELVMSVSIFLMS